MELDKDALNIYTDLAVEEAELRGGALEGVETESEEYMDGAVGVTTVRITGEEGACAMGKPIGTYVTIESAAMKENDTAAHEEIIKILSQRLGELHHLEPSASVLVMGLGNQFVTPDALGPKVVSKILITRHIMDSLPEELEGGVRAICALAPGVMGLTGIETAEIAKALVDCVKPDLVVAVDALAARRASRINATIQMSDAGINPGSGLGNRRAALNRETLGVPVIALGVPTVIGAASLVNDTLDMMLDSIRAVLEENSQPGGAFYDMLEGLDDNEKHGIIRDILNPYIGDMFVAPKDTDDVVRRLSNIIANAVNIALHPGISRDDINRYIS